MKEAKKIKNNASKSNVGAEKITKNEITKLITIAGIVTIVFAIFYGITLLVDKKQESKEETGILKESIQYDEILVGQVLNRSEKEYYVLLEGDNNNYNELYVAYLKTYVNSEKTAKYYTVDLSNDLNLPYISDITSIDKNNFLNSRFADTVLIKVKNSKISKVYSTHEDIFAMLKKIVA